MSCTLTASVCFVAGRVAKMRFTVTDENDAVVDISSGYSASFAMARTFGGTVIIGTDISPANATTDFSDGVNGIFDVTIEPEDNADLRGDYTYEATLTDFEGTLFSIARGYSTFERGVG